MFKIAGFPCFLKFFLCTLLALVHSYYSCMSCFPSFSACFLLFLCLLTSTLTWRLVHIPWPALLSFLNHHLELSDLYFWFFPPFLKVFFFFSSFITFLEFMFHSFFQMLAYMSSLMVRKLILPRTSMYFGDSYC